tara:strand:+ start:1463 stop:2761 length:1299 start_codon:yes stop_codon:yes gene_type:complete
MNSGSTLYKKAKRMIPGGTQLLSKRPEMFLPEKWPSYYKKAVGCEIWDLDDNRYIDMSIMGIGTSSLGYANPAVNMAVIESIKKGSFSTLNSYEEVELAEKILDLHPTMDMIRFAKCGGEANSIAIRIARAATGKTKVAISGYHGWHDWYLAANLNNKSGLDGLLLPGLDTAGVPKELEGTAFPFHYGNLDELKAIIDSNPDLGAICIEVQRGGSIDISFLSAVRKLANKTGAILIFDEISSGFRMSIGGIYKNYNLEPDMVVLGKALGNGFGISAVLGKRAIMQSAQNSFISSSYWTERTGYVAALATINQFEECNVISYITDIASYFRAAFKRNIDNDIAFLDGLHTVPTIIFKHEDPILAKTFFTQEMLKKGYIASTVIYLSYAHNKKILDDYISVATQVIELIKYKNAYELLNLLNGPASHSTFARLT